MKKLAIVAGVIFIIIGALFATLFTPSGSNTIIKPIINKELAKKLAKPKIEITNLEHSLNQIVLDALIEETITLHAIGNISYFQKSFDIKYYLKAKELTLNNQSYPLHLNIQGEAKGDIKNFAVNGQGEAFDSTINYNFRVHNNLVEYITANIYNAKIAQILLLAKQKPFLDGLVNLNINMPSLNLQNPSGEAKLAIPLATFNRKLFYQNYKILLPKEEKLKALLHTKVAQKKVLSYGDINTTTAKLHIKKLVSTLDFKVAKGYFHLAIKNLSRLNKTLNYKLKGSFDADIVGYINQKKKITQALLTTKSFGGLTKAKYSNEKLKLSLKNLNIPKIEKMLSLPLYVTKGNINGSALLKNFTTYETDFSLSSTVDINKKAIKLPLPSYHYKIATKALFKDLALRANYLKVDASYVKFIAKELKYSVVSKALTSKFDINILNLAALKKTISMPLQGKLNLYGDILLQGNNIKLHTSTKSLGGLLNVTYRNDSLYAKYKNLSLPTILYTLKQAPIVKKGFLTGELSLESIKKLQGKASLKANALINNKILKKRYKIDIGKDRALFLKATSITLKNHKAFGDILIKTKGAIVNLYDALYNINSQSIKANYGVSIADLAILTPLIKQKLKGSLKVVGELSKNGKYLLVSGTSSKFDGTINFLLKGDTFTLNGAGLSIIKLLDMLNKPKNFDGIAKVNLTYNLKSKKGKFTIIIDNGQFLNSKLVESLKLYANFDLSKELFNKVLIDGEINNNIIIFNVATKSQKVKINIHKGKIDIKANTIYAKVRVHFNGNDYNFIVKGPLDDPHYRLSYSGVVKKKVQKKVKEQIKKLGLDKEIKKVVPKELQDIDEIIPPDTKKSAKELLKGLFK